MKQIEKLHLGNITDTCEHSSYCTDKECNILGYTVCKTDVQAASKCAEITEQIAIEFADWLDIHSPNKELFAEFLKTKQ